MEKERREPREPKEARETRAGKYGRFLSVWINDTLSTRDFNYRALFDLEIRRYSFIPRKKGEPRNYGCVFELEGIDDLDMRNPEHFAKTVKEGFHLMYQKQTSFNAVHAVWENL